MRSRRFAPALAGLLSIGALLAACGPAAEPTPTSAPPTPTTAAAPTATAAAAQATVQATPTRAAASAATATVAETRLRPVPVAAAPGPNPQAQKGGIYRRVDPRNIPDFGIWDSSNAITFQPAVPATDALLDTNEYEDGKREQLLASLAYDWWTNAAGTVWTFKLRQGVKYTDGVEMTCADAKFMLDTIRLGRDATGATLRQSPRGSLVRRIDETRCPDNYTLEVASKAPLPSLARTLAQASFAVLPRHVYEGHLDVWLKGVGPGLGPFMPKESTEAEVFKLKRNPNYWNQPYPYLDEFHLINPGSVTAAQAAFRVGRAEDINGGMPKSVRDQMEKDGKIVVQGKFANDSVTFFQSNWTIAPWSDPRFSLALRCTIDTKKVIDTASNGEGFEGPHFPLARDPGGSEWAITEAEWKAVHPCHGPSGDAANMEKRRQIAKDLLAQLGIGPNNIAKPRSYMSQGNATWVSVLEDLKAVYIEPVMRIVNTDQQYVIQTSGDADIFSQGAVDSRRDPDHWLYAKYYSTSDRNYGKYRNAEVDILIDKQSQTLDKAERYKLLQQIEKQLLKDNAMIIGIHSYFARPLPVWVKDSYWGPPTNNQNTGAHYARAWIDQAKMKQVLGQ